MEEPGEGRRSEVLSKIFLLSKVKAESESFVKSSILLIVYGDFCQCLRAKVLAKMNKYWDSKPFIAVRRQFNEHHNGKVFFRISVFVYRSMVLYKKTAHCAVVQMRKFTVMMMRMFLVVFNLSTQRSCDCYSEIVKRGKYPLSVLVPSPHPTWKFT